jgi:transposase
MKSYQDPNDQEVSLYKPKRGRPKKLTEKQEQQIEELASIVVGMFLDKKQMEFQLKRDQDKSRKEPSDRGSIT